MPPAAPAPRRIALVTSGLGPTSGGVGVVSEMIVEALEPDCDLSLWRNRPQRSKIARIGRLAATAFLGGLARPDLVFYEHVDLARLHALVPSLRRVPFGVFLHGVEVWDPLDARRRAALIGAKVLLANSSTTVRWARASNPWLPEARATWLGVQADRLADPHAPRPPVALIVGRMASRERYKGHDPILDAWPEIRRAVPAARLLVVGEGDDLPRLRRRVELEGIDGVEFRGWISDDERAALYRSSRLFLFPSRREGFGLAPVEAAAAGMPVLGLRGSVLEELFPGGRGVALVDEPTGPQIAAAAIPPLADPALASALGRAAHDRVNETFLREHFLTRFREALAPFLA